uniref:RING-type domain-containing protein n=1 Tax=Oryza nivara TaxID=4536 RepID=A0A0E0I165_ORYNI
MEGPLQGILQAARQGVLQHPRPAAAVAAPALPRPPTPPPPPPPRCCWWRGGGGGGGGAHAEAAEADTGSVGGGGGGRVRHGVRRGPRAAGAEAEGESSDASSGAGAGCGGGAGCGAELPPAAPRASSLIQRWREIEAVGPATPRPCDLASDSDGGSPRGRVGCIVKKLSGTSSIPDDELDAANKEVAMSQSAPPSPAPMRAGVEPPTNIAGINGSRPTQLVVRTVRGRRAMEELVAMMAHCRRCELAAVADRHVVSRFSHKGRIQSMLRLRLLRQGFKVKDEVWTLPKPVRPRLPKHEHEAYTTSQCLTQAFLSKCIAGNQHKGGQVLAEKSTGSVERLVSSDGLGNEQNDGQNSNSENQCQEGCKNMVKLCTQNQEYSEPSSFVRYDEHSTVDDVSPSTISTLHELCTPSSRGDNLREEDNQSLNGSWEERALWISSLGWPAPVEAMSPDSWNQDEIGDIENHTQNEFNDRPWIDSPNSWRSLCVATQADSGALSGNADICNLLESKNVSKSLESDFSNKMNNMLLTILRKQRQQHMIDDFEGYYDKRLYWRQNDEQQNADQRVSAQCSLAPVSHLHQQEGWQHSSFEHQHHENQNFLEMEVRVRSEMAQVHHEIYELRKLVESCIASQVKIQHSIKEEMCSALREAGLMPSQPDTPAKRGSCCICHQTQVDSLLYRCGHMCTCFNCADQLKSSNRSCPICQSPIEDVVRAHMNF